MVLSEERREQLEEIDASWCPSWPVTWQRAFHLVRMHLDAGEALPTEAGDVLRQGEDLGRWMQSVRYGWDELTTVQQWMCEQVLGIEPAPKDEKPQRPRTQADKWNAHLAAARQFYERESHLKVPRKHVETVSEDGREDQYRLGGVGQQPAEPGRPAVAGAGGGALQERHAMGVMVSVLVTRSDGIGERNRLAGGSGIIHFPARGLADVPARVDDQNPVRQVDPAQMKSAQRLLLLLGERPVRIDRRDSNDPLEGQIPIHRTHLLNEPGGSADADNLRSVGHSSSPRSNGTPTRTSVRRWQEVSGRH
ncbi:hypothetical protein ACFW17_34000 [Streptomyces sp. NPDC058961]|uniref:hypothetical protein n=1 Tax=Streptomyces sp. NPDC058961 TaxID=3346680 RepID=UPI003687203C